MDKPFIENVIGGFNLDYGLLHFQLNTPLFTLIILLIMIYTLNTLLFQPVLRTLKNREEFIKTRKDKSSGIQAEIDSLKGEYEARLTTAKTEISQVLSQARTEAQAHRSTKLHQVKKDAEAQLQKDRTELAKEVEIVKSQLQKQAIDLANLTAKRLLN